MEQTEQAEKGKSYWHKPESYVGLFTLLAVLTYTGVQIYQTSLLYSNNIVSQRAFVFAAPTQGYISFEPLTYKPRALNWFISLANSGNTATRDLQYILRCAPAAEDLEEPWSIFHQGTGKLERAPSVIGPHSAVVTGCSFTYDQITDMAEGKLFGYLMLDMKYYDRIKENQLHRTQMSYKLDQVSIQRVAVQPEAPVANIQALLIGKGRHNCADEECPE